jgi:phosphopantothenoylcysteine decarboxylase/phosphopantothenate--cysteine ligase
MTAAEMRTAVMQKFSEVDIAIMAAAVADYTPENPETHKIKKVQNQWQLPLTKTVDILAEMGKSKRPDQVLVGFALETDRELEHAFSKLENKNADFIVLNSLNDEGAGFKCKTNRVTIINKHKDIIRGELKDKAQVAADIVDVITTALLNNKIESYELEN